jgi:hypothetical protein
MVATSVGGLKEIIFRYKPKHYFLGHSGFHWSVRLPNRADPKG